MNAPAHALIALAALGACANTADRRGGDSARSNASGERWVATWAASPQPADPPFQITGQTLRQIVHVSMGGSRVRVRLSNAFGTTRLDVGSAHVAVHAGGPSVIAPSDRKLTFGGSPNVSILPGASVVSDPALLAVPALGELAVSLFLPGSVSATTEHSTAVQTTYVSSAGDFSGADTLASPHQTQSWYFVTAVDVEGPPRSAAIVALGDSVTDSLGSTPDANHRWPDFLAERLHAARGATWRGIVNEGISGNCVLGELVGPSALDRLDRDVFTQSGARYVIFLEGANDIGPANATPEQVIAGYREIVRRAHARGLKIFGGTILPFEGATYPGFDGTAREEKREAVNQWIRTSGAYDAVLDFDRTVRDPMHPARLLPAFDSGDHIHPNDAGYKAMADAIDLSLFDDARD